MYACVPLFIAMCLLMAAPTPASAAAAASADDVAAAQVVKLDGGAGGPRFDGIGVVNGGGATSVLLKDYPEPQRSQILDLLYKPRFGASVSALLVEIPGDGNSTQGSMPSHMHTRDDLNYHRGYTWWVLREAKRRNPRLTLDGTAWSAPGWIGSGKGDDKFWSPDAADYYVKWLRGLRDVYGLEFDAIGCRNEKGYSLAFAKLLRNALDANGFDRVKIHAFDHWPDHKFDFVKDLLTDADARHAIDVIGAHVMYEKKPAPPEVQRMAAEMGKPIWNTEDHVYKKGFDCAISIVECFNENFIRSGATKIVNWYDIAGVYPIEPYSEDPAAVLAHWPWSGHYRVREALWGYAHYGQFTEVGWQYLNGGSGDLARGGTFVTLSAPAPADDYSVIIETREATGPQQIRFNVGGGLSAKELCVWRSNATEQFVRQAAITPEDGAFTVTVEPDSIYSLSTTTGQQKGSFDNIPPAKAFPFPYCENFEQYGDPKQYGYLPRYTADIAGAFELVGRPDGQGKCVRQVVPIPTISWAPDWQPYTVLGDDQWRDYEVSGDVYLNAGESAAVMGRVNHVGTGYGFIPKGYLVQLGDDGTCRLVVVRGKIDKKKLVGDAEQQAIIKAGKDDGEGGEKVLGAATVADVRANAWQTLKLRFDGSTITAFVNGKQVLRATDTLYARGMAGLLAGADRKKLSTPYFDNVLVNAVGAPAPAPEPTSPAPGHSPIYARTGAVRHEEVAVKAPFAMPPIKVPVFPARDFPITDFGAKPGGEIDNTDAIRHAIAACHDAGGGRVVVPAGEWLTGAVHLKSNVNLHLAKGAVLSFSDDPKAYLPPVQSSWEGMECFNYSPLVYAFECENVAITGPGKLEARMGTWKQWFARPKPHMDALVKLYNMASKDVPVAQRQMAQGQNNLRPQFVQFNRCRNVLVEDVRIRNSPFWTVHLLLCDSVVVRRIDISAHGHNNDGIDPEMTRNLLIEDCRFDQGDDAIAIKSGRNHDGWRLNVPTENVVMRNCTVVRGHQLVAIGSELSAGVRNVYVHDCRFENAADPLQNVLFIKANIQRGGFVENIHMANVEAGDVRDSVLGIETDVLYQWKTLAPTYEQRLTKIRGIHVSNVKVRKTGLQAFRILGDEREPVRDIVLDDITVGQAGVAKSRYENVENVRETHITVGEVLPQDKQKQ